MFKEKIIIEMKEVFKEIPFGIEHTCLLYTSRISFVAFAVCPAPATV